MGSLVAPDARFRGSFVRPSARGRGYAKAMLGAALPLVAGLGIDPAEVTCNVSVRECLLRRLDDE